MSFIEPFLIQAILGGIGIALICGPLGSYVIWHRMAYFGDTISHAALLGIALSLFLNVHFLVGVLAICVLIGLLLISYNKHHTLPLSNDSIFNCQAYQVKQQIPCIFLVAHCGQIPF